MPQKSNYEVFQVVPGATINGHVEPNHPYQVESTVTKNNDQLDYIRRFSTGSNVSFEVRVAHRGEYHLENRSVTNFESYVMNGSTINLTSPT